MTDYSLGDRGTLTLITQDYYEDEILQVFEELLPDREKIWNGEARLVPEADNPYEPHSIAVYIDDIKIGRFSRQDSAEYWNAITRVVASGYEPIAPLQLSAVMRKINGESYIESEGLLSLSPAHSLFPLNQAPTQAALIPQGPSLKVLDEKDYADYLHSILPPSGESRVILTLETNTVRQNDGSFADSIEVLHDRKKVGRLSTQMSEQLAPVIRYAFERDKLTSVWGTIRGNAFELSLTVQAVRASELPPEWYEELPNNVPELLPPADSYEISDSYKPTTGELHRQNSPKKKRGFVSSLTNTAAPEETMGSVTVTNTRIENPHQRVAVLLGIVGALILIVGVVLVFPQPLTGIIGIVLGVSVIFLGLFMGRSPLSESEEYKAE